MMTPLYESNIVDRDIMQDTIKSLTNQPINRQSVEEILELLCIPEYVSFLSKRRIPY